MKRIKPRLNKLEVIALICGFVLMVFELAGARILAPGIGNSTYIWTSVIGIIIAALSLGYWLGGKIADQRGYAIDIVRLCLLAALTMAWTLLQYGLVIEWVAESFDDPRWQGVVASLLLFAPTSFVLGMISPYLAKLNVRSLKTTGRSIASLSALNSIGGIIGTFTAGFILFGYIGSHETLVITVALMIAASWLFVPRIEWRMRLLVSVGIAVAIAIPVEKVGAVSIDTPSAHYTIADVQGLRLLTTGPGGAQSGIYLSGSKDLAFWYTNELAKIVETAPKKDRILILGGGAFILPQYLAKKYPDSQIDVVEIDPELAAIAREHFGYTDPKNVHLIFEDARAYVNQTKDNYDIVLVDVYSDAHIPFTLATKEYAQKLSSMVGTNGVVGVNVIANLSGECLTLFESIDAAYRSQFKTAEFTIDRPQEHRSNIVIAYSQNGFWWPGSGTLELTRTTPYTDNYMPIERLYQDCGER